MDDRKTRIRAFLGKFFRNREIGDGEDIFALGFVNSLLAVQLVAFLEKEFRIKVEDDDLDLDNFRSIERLDALVARKRGEGDAAGAAGARQAVGAGA
ncbi:MAG TPA: phosphopantetheine-binding protein [Thermoanaerobaculia bacterium]|nr:phosphopantetheine-binding protein [Thermoanaerobaculia bacterium]